MQHTGTKLLLAEDVVTEVMVSGQIIICILPHTTLYSHTPSGMYQALTHELVFVTG